MENWEKTVGDNKIPIAMAYLAFGSAIIINSSCKKTFLDENLITSKSLQDYLTPQGLDDLSVDMYQGLKFHFNYEWAYSTTNYGVDEFTVGGDRTEQMWNSYDANLNSLTSEGATVFNEMYSNINSANILIENVPKYYGDNSNKNIRIGEGYFMRAFDYFKLVKQFGGSAVTADPNDYPANGVCAQYREGNLRTGYQRLYRGLQSFAKYTG